MPGFPTIVSVSPEPAEVAFSFQGNTLSGFILIFGGVISPFPFNKHIQCGQNCLGPKILAVCVDVVHLNLQLRVSYFV